ncbi:MAG: sterol desaturase family protein [Deltaproteobacteria bacterium]|nr:sterol desaturase family protein [Deltaproteobacteria bacterium]
MFWLAPHEAVTRPQPGSPRMFRVEFIEKYLSRVKPWHIVSVWGPLSAYLLYRGLRDPSMTLATWAELVAGGIFFWTLLEYILHRGVFHFPFNKKSEVQNDLSFLIHGIHHDYPNDADRLVMPPTITAVVAVMVGVPVWFIAGPHAFFPFFGATMVGYIWYDLTHYALHHVKAFTPWGKRQKQYHLVHHYQTPHMRYGVTTPLWDIVFGTYVWGSSAPASGEQQSTAAH